MANNPLKIRNIPPKAFQPGRSPKKTMPSMIALTGIRNVTSKRKDSIPTKKKYPPHRMETLQPLPIAGFPCTGWM
jgi:hypothetical protein